MTRGLRILTWNTWLQTDPSSKPDPNPSKRAPLIAAKLRASAPPNVGRILHSSVGVVCDRSRSDTHHTHEP